MIALFTETAISRPQLPWKVAGAASYQGDPADVINVEIDELQLMAWLGQARSAAVTTYSVSPPRVREAIWHLVLLGASGVESEFAELGKSAHQALGSDLHYRTHGWLSTTLFDYSSAFSGQMKALTPRKAVSGIQALWERLGRSLDRWERLPRHWEGDDSVPPPKASIDAARFFLGMLQAKGIAPPKGYVAGDGEIGFRWRKERWLATAAFIADGSFVGFARTSDGPPVRMDVPYAPLFDPSDLIERLNFFA